MALVGRQDAFLDAERCATAVDAWLRGARYDDVMRAWHVARDAHAMPIYEFTSEMATLEPPPPDLAAVLAGVSRSPEASDQFAGVIAGVVSPAEFFAPDNLATLLAA